MTTAEMIAQAEREIAKFEVQYAKAEEDLDALGLRIKHAKVKLENVKRLAGVITETVNAR